MLNSISLAWPTALSQSYSVYTQGHILQPRESPLTPSPANIRDIIQLLDISFFLFFFAILFCGHVYFLISYLTYWDDIDK